MTTLPAPIPRPRSPIWRFGGKGRMVPKLLPFLPSHTTYVEPFGGGASLLLAKAPAPVEVYNDLDGGLVNLFRVLRDPELFERFERLASLTPYSREEWLTCRGLCASGEDPVGRAWAFFTVARQSFGGNSGGSWGMNVTKSARGMARNVSAYLGAIDGLEGVHQRLMAVQVEHADWRRILERYDTPETLWYCDPPYMPETRSAGGYTHELTAGDHEELVARLLTLEGMALLSCYDHAVYQPLEAAGWERRDWATSCHAAGRTRASALAGIGSASRCQGRTESLWINPAAQERLLTQKEPHDEL